MKTFLLVSIITLSTFAQTPAFAAVGSTGSKFVCLFDAASSLELQIGIVDADKKQGLVRLVNLADRALVREEKAIYENDLFIINEKESVDLGAFGEDMQEIYGYSSLKEASGTYSCFEI